MIVHSLNCPNCNAPLDVKNARAQLVKCIYCDSIVRLVDESNTRQAALKASDAVGFDSLPIEEKLVRIIDKYIHDIPTEKYKAYNLSELQDVPSIAENARNKIGFRSTGTAIGLVDTSLFDNGKAGFYFTTEGFSFDYIFQKVFVRYDEIESFAIDEKGKNLVLHGVFKGTNAPHQTTPEVSSVTIHLLVLRDMIAEIVDVFANVPKENSSRVQEENDGTTVGKLKSIIKKHIHSIPTPKLGYSLDADELSRVPSTISNARNNIGVNATGDAIGLVDNSIFSNGKSGILLTTDGIAVSGPPLSGERFWVRYDDIHSLELLKDGKKLLFKGNVKGVKKPLPKQFELEAGSYIIIPALKDMLDEILRLVR